jgi:hypothetical protein
LPPWAHPRGKEGAMRDLKVSVGVRHVWVTSDHIVKEGHRPDRTMGVKSQSPDGIAISGLMRRVLGGA